MQASFLKQINFQLIFSLAISRLGNWLANTAQKSLVLMKAISGKLAWILLYLRCKLLSEKLFTYDDIPLKLFIEIATYGDLKKLIIKGAAMPDRLALVFEEIVKKNSDSNGSSQYNNYFQLLKDYSLLVADYTIVKALVMQLSVNIYYPAVKEIRARGYKIDLTNSTTYAASLTAAMRKVDNLITRAAMKKKEIERLQESKEGASSDSFEAILANLSTQLGFAVPQSITLAGFNEYRKILKERNRSKK